MCQATTAAPTYFPPVQFTLQDTQVHPPRIREFNMIDGGLAVNNLVNWFLPASSYLWFFFFNSFFNSFWSIYTTFSTLNFGMSCANVLPDLCGNYTSNQGSANRWWFCRKNELYGLCFYPFLELIDNLDFFIFLGFREGWTSSNGRVKPVLNLKVCAHNCHEVWQVVTEASIDILVKCLLCAFFPHRTSAIFWCCHWEQGSISLATLQVMQHGGLQYNGWYTLD